MLAFPYLLASPKSSMSLRDREGNENRLFRAGAGVVGDFQRNLPVQRHPQGVPLLCYGFAGPSIVVALLVGARAQRNPLGDTLLGNFVPTQKSNTSITPILMRLS